MLGDVVIAEPKALIGFAGPRVIEQTIRQKLPEGFQRSEFPARRHARRDARSIWRELKAAIGRSLRVMLGRPAAPRTAAGIDLPAETKAHASTGASTG